MKIRSVIALVLVVVGVSACVIEPVGGRGYYGGGHDYYGRGYEPGVWRN